MINLIPKSFRFPLTPKQKQQLVGLGEPFSDEFADLVYRLNDEGRRVFILSDHPGSMDESAIFSGQERAVFHNILKYTIRQSEEPISDLYFISWPRALVDPGRGNKDDKRRMASANQIFLHRCLYLIGKLKPDVVILCGTGPFATFYRHFSEKGRVPFQMNRVLEATIYEHKFQYLGTVDIFRACSWDQKHRNFGQLIGWISKGWRQAINGRPDYTVVTDNIIFKYIDTIGKFDAFYEELIVAKIVASDTEGSGLGRITSKLFCLQYSFDGRTGYFIPLDHWDTPFSADELEYIRKKLRHYYEFGTSYYHIWQYGKYDVTQLYNNIGIRFYNHRIYDTQAARWALDENLKGLQNLGIKPNSLEYMTEADYNNDIYQRIEFSKGDRNKISQEGFTQRLIEYGIYDAVIIYQIHRFQRHEAKTQDYDRFLRYVTIQLSDKIIALAQMEYTGAPIDKRQIYRLAAADGPVAKTIKAMQQKFRDSPQAKKVNDYLLQKKARTKGDMFGEKSWIFDISKAEHKQLLFFHANKLEPLSRNADGSGSVNKAFIARYMGENKDVHAYAELTKAETINNNFVKTLLSKIQEDEDTLKDNRVRSSYNYTIVVGGRLSSNSPNLQNIPNRDDKTFSESFAKDLKSAFAAEPFCLTEAADFSANEIREWCNEAKDTTLADSFYQGMKMRRELRIWAIEHPSELASWTKFKKDHNWNKIEKKTEGDKEISIHAQKMALIDTINDPDVQKFGAIELALSVSGDLHYVNASIAFQVDVLDVTASQRHDIKAIVFGTLYGKIALSFAKSKAEGGLGYSEEKCQEIIDRLFNQFTAGKQWIDDIQQMGFDKLYIESPLGMRRHLPGFLHTRKAFINALNRRSGNASIQGTASEIGVTTMRLVQWVLWHFFTKHNVPVYWKCINNYVHDAVYSQVPIPFLPVYTYIREHASTTLVHRYYAKHFDYNLIIGVEGESAIGANLANAERWDFSGRHLLELAENGIKFQREKLGYEYTPKQYDRMLKGMIHNTKIIEKLRLEELKLEVKNENRVAKTMLLTEKNARSLGIYTGMDLPVKH